MANTGSDVRWLCEITIMASRAAQDGGPADVFGSRCLEAPGRARRERLRLARGLDGGDFELAVARPSDAATNCPAGWQLFDNFVTHYTVCFPPGWVYDVGHSPTS